jgi:hypothetical protein
MKTGAWLGALVAAGLMAAPSRADDKAACLDAASKAQSLRDAHKLVEAREQLRACAAARCPAVVQNDCATWLVEVERALPTVVLAAKNTAGADLVDVRVSVDGDPLLSKLEGQALAMNAGPHTFHFAGADGTSLDSRVVVKEGEKNQTVSVVLGAAAQSTPAVPAGGAGAPSPLKTVGWVLGGAGVVGLGVAAAFGVKALSDKNAAHCMNNECDPGTSSGIKSAALTSDIAWAAGGVLVATGLALVVLSPSGGGRESATSVSVVPLATATGGRLVLSGSW